MAKDPVPCWACGIPDHACEWHHMAPVSANGSDDPSNKVPLCMSCHTFLDRRRLQSSVDILWLLAGLLNGETRQWRLMGLLCIALLAETQAGNDIGIDKALLQSIATAVLEDRFDTIQLGDNKKVLHDLLLKASKGKRLFKVLRDRGREARKAQGFRIGEIPYGYVLDPETNKLVEHPEERVVIEQILRMREVEKRSFCSIADTLTEGGIPTKKNGAYWSYKLVQRIVARESSLQSSQAA